MSFSNVLAALCSRKEQRLAKDDNKLSAELFRPLNRNHRNITSVIGLYTFVIYNLRILEYPFVIYNLRILELPEHRGSSRLP
jgi:hypothetical protein